MRNTVDFFLAAVLVAGCAGAWPSSASSQPAVELGVEDAVAAALTNQPRLKAIASQSEAAEALERQKRLNRIGELSAAFLYTPEQKPLTVRFAGLPPLIPPLAFDVKQVETYSAMASYSLPLWTWGALGAERSATADAAAARRLALARAKQQVVLEAQRAFWRASAAGAGVDVATLNLDQQKAFLRVTRLRAEAGIAARLDQLKAELAVARAEADLNQARNREQLSREALITATSDERFRRARLKALEDDARALPEAEQAVALALASRPDLGAQRSQAGIIRHTGDALEASRRPVLAARAQVTQQNSRLGEMLNKDSQLYQVGLGLSWDVTKSIRGGAAVAEQRALERSVEQSLSASESQVALEVRNALISAREARERVDLQRRAVEVAEEQARVARLAYGEGAITAVEAQDAELSVTATRFALLQARLDLAEALAELRCAVGD